MNKLGVKKTEAFLPPTLVQIPLKTADDKAKDEKPVLAVARRASLKS